MIDPEVLGAIQDSVHAAFSSEGEKGRYVDVTRVPLICQSIITMSGDIKDIKDSLERKYVTRDQFWPIRILVYGAVGIMLTGVFLALGFLLIKGLNLPS